ncbi:acylneuraminate cytidylyltransferase family protein [Pseudomonas flexibilis]|nr:acylneuraminate cytidylyltransferase family protein [Pseudomonas flexibilis]
MHDKISCFLPCRKGSERVPRKNIKPFAGIQNGLVELKIRQLLGSNLIDEIVLSTNDEEILSFAHSLGEQRVRVHERVDALASSQTSTDELVAHALNLIPVGHILWTHVTSPFFNSSVYDSVIKKYLSCLAEGYDSLMTTTLLHAFLWQDNKPLNYDRTIEKWPRTQTIKPIHDVNSGAFLASAEIYRDQDDRIGVNPFLYSLDKIVSHDIDWPEDFYMAEALVEKGLVSI